MDSTWKLLPATIGSSDSESHLCYCNPLPFLNHFQFLYLRNLFHLAQHSGPGALFRVCGYQLSAISYQGLVKKALAREIACDIDVCYYVGHQVQVGTGIYKNHQKPSRTYAYCGQPNRTPIIIVCNCMPLFFFVVVVVVVAVVIYFVFFWIFTFKVACMWLVDVVASCFCLWGKNAKILEIGFNAGHSVCLMLCLGWSTEWLWKTSPAGEDFELWCWEKVYLHFKMLDQCSACLPSLWVHMRLRLTLCQHAWPKVGKCDVEGCCLRSLWTSVYQALRWGWDVVLDWILIE